MGRMITIIGGGNLGASIAEGLLKSKFCKPAELTVTKRNISTLKALEQKGVQITTDNSKAVKNGGRCLDRKRGEERNCYHACHSSVYSSQRKSFV